MAIVPWRRSEERSLAERDPFGYLRNQDKEIKVSAEIPGVEPKDIDVSVEDGILTIKGEKKYEREEKEKGQYRMERSYGSFERTIELPAEVDESKAKAEFKKGVLRLTLPKRPGAPSRRKRISVT